MIKVYIAVEKLRLVKPFVMLKNVGQNIILLIESEPPKHLVDFILLATPKDGRTRKKTKVFFIAKLKPSLNRQVEFNMPTLLRNRGMLGEGLQLKTTALLVFLLW